MKNLLIALFCISSTFVFSQKIDNCSQLSSLINFNEIWNGFKFESESDSLILVDRNGVIIKNCLNVRLIKHTVQVTHDSALVIHAKKEVSSFYFHSPKYFVFDDFKQNGNQYTFLIFQASSNEFVKCKVSKNKNQYRLLTFSRAAW